MSAALSALLDGYLSFRGHLDPVEVTAQGGRRHEFDGALARYDRESVREQLAALRGYTVSLEETEADSLDDEIDRTAALHAARHDILMLERERPFARDPGFHLAHALNGLFLLLVRENADHVARARALLSRLRELPEFLEIAAGELTRPAAVFVEGAREMLATARTILEEAFDDPALDLTAIEPDALEDARTRASDALAQFGDALALLDERATHPFALGRDVFDRKLHTAHMIQDSADELARFGERLRADAHAELERVAEELSPGSHWRDMAARLRADTVPASELTGEYAEALDSARTFTGGRELMSVPGHDPRVVTTPELLSGLVPVVRYVEPGQGEDERALLLLATPERAEGAAHARAELYSAAAHEGVPGRHQQAMLWRRLARPVRRVLWTPAAREGWAFYAETLLGAEGFLRTPAARFFHALRALRRALWVVLDVSLHTKGMPVERAEQILREDGGVEASEARADVRRCCSMPTYLLCAAVGRREIVSLREDARRAAGAGFSLSTFHDALLRYGALPTALARWGMGLA
ncbi:MAG: DUF885 domain-containing protein [Gemmatimonadaceae bacterium]